MVKIRLTRVGKKKAPFYHIVVADSRFATSGRIIEQIGTMDPMTDPATIKLDVEKAQDWIKKGAKPTDTVKALIEKAAPAKKVEKAKKEEKTVATEEKEKKPDWIEIGQYHFNPTLQRLEYAGIETEMSHRESEILRRLCENRNQVVNTQNILLELWGDDSFFNNKSLHVFITKLRHKLSKDSQIRIVNVRGIGYKLID